MTANSAEGIAIPIRSITEWKDGASTWMKIHVDSIQLESHFVNIEPLFTGLFYSAHRELDLEKGSFHQWKRDMSELEVEFESESDAIAFKLWLETVKMIFVSKRDSFPNTVNAMLKLFKLFESETIPYKWFFAGNHFSMVGIIARQKDCDRFFRESKHL